MSAKPRAVRRWVVLLTAAIAFPARAETWRLPLDIVSANGCRHDARSAELLERVPGPDANGRIWLDATQPVRWAGDPNAAPASEGRLDSPFAEYHLAAPAARSYTLWALVSAPVGRFMFVEVLNGQRLGGPFDEEYKEAPAPPHWVRCLRLPLAAGLNRLAVSHYGYRTPFYHAFVLTPNDDEEIAGDPNPPVTTPVTQVSVETAELLLPGLRRVIRLDGLPEAQPCQVSADGGAIWRDLPPDGLDVSDRARFRFDLTPAAPRAGPLSVDVETTAGALLALRDERTELLFSGDGGGLFLARGLDGTPYSGGLAPSPGAAVDLKRRGEAVWTRVDGDGRATLTPKPQYSRGPWDLQATESVAESAPAEVGLADGGLTVVRILSAPNSGRARVTERIEPLGAGLWRFAVTVETIEGPADVVAVTWPRLNGVRIGNSGLDDVQLRPQSFGHQALQPGRSPVRDESYCGGVVMNWTQVYDADHSLYLGIHDPDGLTTLHSSTAAGPEGERVGLLTRRLDEIPPGERATWEAWVAIGGGGWHDGARLYGDWFTGVHGQADYPDWLRTCDGWLDLQIENYPGLRFSELPDYLTRARAIGIDWLQVWGQFAYDWGPCCSAWYGPSPYFGGTAEWRAAAAAIKARGGRLGGYFIYDCVDRLPVFLDSFLGHFSKADYGDDVLWDSAEAQHPLLLVADPAGTVPPLRPTDAELAEWRAKIDEHQGLVAEGKRAEAVQWWHTTYIPDPAWQDYLSRWVAGKYVGEYGCNAAYIDVLGTGGASLSYDPRRGHNGDGRWGDGRRALAKALLERARAIDPDFALSQEGLGDLPGLYASPMCSGVYWGGRNVYRYAFPDRVLFHGMANAGSAGDEWDRFLETFSEAMRYDLVGGANALSLALLTLHRQFTPALWQATFLDTLGLSAADPALRVRRLESTTPTLPGQLLTLVDESATGGVEVGLDEAVTGPLAAAFMVPLDGPAQALELRHDAGWARFTSPPALAALVWLPPAETTAPCYPVVRLKRDEPPAVEVTVFNPSEQARSGECRLTLLGLTEPFDAPANAAAERLPLAAFAQDYRVEPRGAMRLAFPVRDLAPFDWTVRLAVELQPTAGEPVRREVLVIPAVLDGSFDVMAHPSEQAFDGAGALHLPPTTQGFQHALIDLSLLPAHRYRLSFQVRRTGFQAEVRGALLRQWKHSPGYVDHRFGEDTGRPDEWQQLGGEFETAPDMVRIGLYLYNVRSPEHAWFDRIRVEDLGPL